MGIRTSNYTAAIVVIDGCTISCLKRANTPFLDRLVERGSSSLSCMSIYPTVTYAVHTSILTGVRPNVHGIVGNEFYDRKRGKVINLDEYDVNSLLLSKTLFEMVDELIDVKVAIGEPVTKGADIVITKEEVQGSGFWTQDEYAIEKAMEIILEHKPGLMVINMPGMDAVCEKYGPKSEEAIRTLEKVDNLIERLDLALSDAYSDHLLVVVSDHGLTEVRENLDIVSLLADLVGEEGVVICPSHRFAHVYLLSGKEREVKNLLKSDERLELVLNADELGEIGLSSVRSGDFVVFAKKGYELGPQRLKGSHGGITPEEMFVPLLVNKREYADLMSDPCITVVPSIVLRYLREKRVETKVREKLKGVDPSHGWEHVERVLNTATNLALRYKADVEAVRLAALLHDSERADTPENHVRRSEKFAKETLNEIKVPAPKVKAILRAIRNHHTNEPEKLETPEEKVLWDADKLDALGLIGLARCLQQAGYMGLSISHALNHLKKDLETLTDTMHFDLTKRIAQEKLRNVRRFISLLKKEVDSWITNDELSG